MPSASSPYYSASNLPQSPAYSEVQLLPRSRSSGTFLKQSRHGIASITLTGQDGDLPAYGSGGIVDGIISFTKTEDITSIEIKIEGRLQLKEIAEGGTVDNRICLASALLWSKEQNTHCPSSCPFRLTLPSTFDLEGQSYNLPPTYSVKLSGLPGFTALAEYSICAAIGRASFLGIGAGTTILAAPFVYYPRTRPAAPLPAPLHLSQNGFEGTSDWQLYESTITARRSSLQDIKTRIYVPISRIFSASQGIPFHVTFESSAVSLASFLPFGPSGLHPKKPTRVQIMRQVAVDVRNEMVFGTKTDMWRVDCLGEAIFKHVGDGPTWTSFSGHIPVDPSIKVMGFKAGGLTVADCILFSMTPPEPRKSPFNELRQVVPIRLTTDPWAGGFANHNESELSVLSLNSSLE